MSALAKPPPAVLAVLAVGALWWLSQRRAGASSAAVGDPQYGQAGAVRAPAVRSYLIPPAGTAPAAAGPQSALQSVLSAGLALIGRTPAATPGTAPQNIVSGYSYGGPSTGVYGAPATDVAKLVEGYGQGGPSMGVYGSSNSEVGRAQMDYSAGGPSTGVYGVEVSRAELMGYGHGGPSMGVYGQDGSNYDAVIVGATPAWNMSDEVDAWPSTPI